MDRLFLAANVLFSAAYRADNGLLRLWKLPDTTLVSSRYALEEARVNLDREDQRNALAQLANDLELFEAPQKGLRPAIRLPEKDIPIILAAIEAQATHLLTGDLQHFGSYFGKKVEGVVVILPGEYLRLREK